jgi:hypothetical protein
MVQWEKTDVLSFWKQLQELERTKYFFHWISTNNYSQCKPQIKQTNDYNTQLQSCNSAMERKQMSKAEENSS